jgi:hypothetical protein
MHTKRLLCLLERHSVLAIGQNAGESGRNKIQTKAIPLKTSIQCFILVQKIIIITMERKPKHLIPVESWVLSTLGE